jgi:hypothetical protein
VICRGRTSLCLLPIAVSQLLVFAFALLHPVEVHSNLTKEFFKVFLNV